jgi:purine-cytosine permease-like protein
MAIPVAAFGLVGVMLQLSTGTWDLSDVLVELGSPTVAYLFVAVGFTGSVMTNLYSGALSLSDAVPRIAHRSALVAVALAGTGLAVLHFSRWMLPYLTIMALSAPALIGICALDALRGARERPGWHVPGLAAWGAGFAVGLALYVGNSSLALPASMTVAAGVYTLFTLRARRGPGPGVTTTEAA